MLKVISTEKAPAAIGPYSQAMVFGNLMISSGQIPIDPATGEIAGTTIQEQAEQVMKISVLFWKRQEQTIQML
jgi:TIGR00004: putative endoribonuclease L-PSP